MWARPKKKKKKINGRSVGSVLHLLRGWACVFWGWWWKEGGGPNLLGEEDFVHHHEKHRPIGCLHLNVAL